jgi:hypothetical protein
MDNTVGCLTRVYIGELPYLKIFIEHGLNIGIEQFYLVFPSQAHADRIQSELMPFRNHCQYFFEMNGRNVNKSLDVDFSLIKTDYLLSIDVDEFVYIDGNKPISLFLKERRIDACHMKWVMSPRDFDTPSGPLSGFIGHIGKRLARTSLVRGVSGPHGFDADPNLRFRRDRHLHLVHYWGRSFEDIVIKCMYQMLLGEKRSSLDEMQALLKVRKLPHRLRVLASLTRHKHDVVLSHSNHKLFDEELQRELLSSVSPDFLAELEGVYREYKDSLDYRRHVATYPELGNIYELGRTLPA